MKHKTSFGSSFSEKKYSSDTKAHKTLWNYYLAISRTERFQKKIAELRKMYLIPKNGFKDKGEKGTLQQWKHKNNGRKKRQIRNALGEICEDYSLHPIDWSDIIKEYLYSNKASSPPQELNAFALCRICDLTEEKSDWYTKNFKEFIKSDDFAYPIAIRVSPYASITEIVEFVRKNADVVKEYQRVYKHQDVKLGRIRTRNTAIQKRNDFIYQHKDLPLKVLASLVGKRFGKTWDDKLDQGHIGKIISLETKKRKEV